MKPIIILIVLLMTAPSLWAIDNPSKILGQDDDGTLTGIIMEQKIGCGPRSCLTNFWQDLDADGLVDIVSLYVVWKNGELKLILQEFLIRKTLKV